MSETQSCDFCRGTCYIELIEVVEEFGRRYAVPTALPCYRCLGRGLVEVSA